MCVWAELNPVTMGEWGGRGTKKGGGLCLSSNERYFNCWASGTVTRVLAGIKLILNMCMKQTKAPLSQCFAILKLLFQKECCICESCNSPLCSCGCYRCDPAEGGILSCCTGWSSPLEAVPTHPCWACACVFAAFLSFVWIVAHQDTSNQELALDSGVTGDTSVKCWLWSSFCEAEHRGEGFLMKCSRAEEVAKSSCSETCPTLSGEGFRAKINQLWLNNHDDKTLRRADVWEWVSALCSDYPG